MGGKALKNLKPKRLNKEDYFSLANEVMRKVHFFWPKAKINLVPTYREKSTFGDLDIAISMADLSQVDITESLIKQGRAFDANEVVRVNNVLSFDHRGFQVDLIFFPEDSYDFSLSYYSWSDLGNLLSQVADNMGLKLRHSGLYHQVRSDNAIESDTLISRDFGAVLESLGYNAVAHNAGFDTLEDIIDFVASGRFFSKSAFSPDKFNAKQRRKYRLRPTFRAMVDYAATLPDVSLTEDDHVSRVLESDLVKVPAES